MSPPFDAAYAMTPSAFGEPAETPEERRMRIRRDRLATYDARMAEPKPPPDPVASPEVSPPLVPNSPTQLQPRRVAGSTAPTPAAAFATEPERAYPGVSATPSLGPLGELPLQRSADVPADAAAAIQSRVAKRDEEMLGVGLEPAERPVMLPARGIPEDQTEDGYWERLGRGLLSRGGDITAGFTQTLSDATQAAALGMGDNQAGAATQGLSDFFMTSTEWLDDIQSESYKPKYNDVGEALEKAKNLDFGYLLGFIAEQAPLTLADALTSLAGAPLYLIATAGDFAAERAENDGRSREELTAKDYAYGSAAAATSFVLDKILLGQGGKLAEGMLGKEVVKQLADFGSSSTMKRVLTSGARGAATESLEESAQQALTTVDTERGATVEDIALAGIGGALAGGPAAAGFDVFAGHPSQRGVPYAEEEEGEVEDVSADVAAAIQATAGDKPMQGPMPLGPMQGPVLPAPPSVPEPRPMQGPMPLGPMQGPPAPGGAELGQFVTPVTEEEEAPAGAEEELAPALPGDTTEADAQRIAEAMGQTMGTALPSGDIAEADQTGALEEQEEAYGPLVPETPEQREKREAGLADAARRREEDIREQDASLISDLVGKERAVRRGVPEDSAYRLLRGLDVPLPKAIQEEGDEEDKRAIRSHRDLLTSLYDNLSSYARILAGRAEQIGQLKPGKLAAQQVSEAELKVAARAAARMQDTAVSMAQARADVMELATGDMQQPGVLPRGLKGMTKDQRKAAQRASLTPYDRVHARFEMVDPLLLQSLGLDPRLLADAAAGTDTAAFTRALQQVSQAAYAEIQRYEAGAGKTRPALPQQGKREPAPPMHPKVRFARELDEEKLKALRSTRDKAAGVATSETLYKVISPETGRLIVPPDLGPEEQAERKALREEEQASRERALGGYDVERVKTAAGPARVRAVQAKAAERLSAAATKALERARRKYDVEPKPVTVVVKPGTKVKTGEPMAKSEKVVPRRGAKKELAKERDELFEKAANQRLAVLQEAVDLAQDEIREPSRQTESAGVSGWFLRSGKFGKLVPKRAEMSPEQVEAIEEAHAAEREAAKLEKELEREARKDDAAAKRKAAAEDVEALKKLRAHEEALARAEKKQAAYKARGGNAELAPTMTKEELEAFQTRKPDMTPTQLARAQTLRTLRHFENDLKASPPRRQGNLARIKALANTIWDKRRDKISYPKKGLWVLNVDPVAQVPFKDEPFVFVRNVVPAVDPETGKRYQPVPEVGGKPPMLGENHIDVYHPGTKKNPQVVGLPARFKMGWRSGADFYDATNQHRTGYRDFPENLNLFSLDLFDQLVAELRVQGVSPDAKVLNDIAWILIDRAGGTTSGTRGYEEGRRQRRKLAPTSTTNLPPRPGTTVVPPAGGASPVDTTPTEEPTEDEPTPWTEQDLVDFLGEIADIIGPNGPTEDQVARFTAATVSLTRQIEDLKAQITQAESILPRIVQEVGEREPENGELEYTAPDGWPPGDSWAGTWWAEEENGNVKSMWVPEPYPGTADATYHKAIVDSVELTIESQRRVLGQLEERLADATTNWTEGGGSPVTVPPRPGGFAAGPGGPGPVVPPGGAQAEPAAPVHVNLGVSKAKRAGARKPVDLLAGVERKPFRDDAYVDRFGPISHQRTLEDGSVIREHNPDEKVSDPQRRTVQMILHTYKERLRLLAKKGWEKSVNRGGFLVANGTGSGKSLVVAMAANAIYERQPQGQSRRVLIVHQDGLDASVKNGFGQLDDPGGRQMLDWQDSTRYHFIPYSDMARDDIQAEEFAAVLFDESHWIKSVVKGKKYAESAAALKAPFRVFLSATPTDRALQEQYYLQYMVQDESKPLTREEALKDVRFTFNTGQATDSQDLEKKWGAAGVEEYRRKLEEIVRDIARDNAIASYTLEPQLVGTVTNITDEFVDAEAAAAAADPRNQSKTVQDRLNEHMKVPAMVRRTLDQLKNKEEDKDWGVIAVFKFSQESETAGGKVAGYPQFNEPAILRFFRGVKEQGDAEGVDVKPALLKGGTKVVEDMASIAADFRNGVSNVLAMIDLKGGTGIDLNDQSPGGMKPKLTLIGAVSGIGQDWLQLQGRTDRANNTSIPYMEYMALPFFQADLDMREMIKGKVDTQQAATGVTTAETQGIISTKAMLHRKLRKRLPTSPPAHESPVDVVVSQRLSEGPQTAASIVEDIARNETDPALAAVARALVGHPALPSIQVVSTTGGEGVLGYAHGRTAYVASGSGSEAITALHEVIHHITHRVIDTNPVVRARLHEIMRAVPRALAPELDEGVLTDPHEFVAAAHSDPRLRRMLQGIKMPSGKTLWQRFKEFVRTAIGARGTTLTAFDAVMELRLTDPGTASELGHGDPAKQLMTTMYRRRLSPERLLEAAEVSSDVGESIFSKILAVMTFDQIVKSYGRLATAAGINYLKAVYNIREQQAAATNRERIRYSKKVLEPLHEWATAHGKRKITVTMAPGGKPQKMYAMQFLAEIMNISGYAEVHFGKDANAAENRMLHQPKGKPPKRTRGHVYWDLFKPQFDKLGPDGVELYNKLADFFAEQVDQVGVMQAANFLDQMSPRADSMKWISDPTAVRAEMKRLGKLSKDDLKTAGIQENSLEQLHAILAPGRRAGAYFPLKRFGDYVVTVKEKVGYDTEEEKNQLLADHLGATDNASRSEVNYKSVSRFESQAHARAFIRRMKAEHPDAEIGGVLLSSATSTIDKAGLSEGLIAQFKKRVDEQDIPEGDKKAQINLFVQSMIDLMPEASYADTFRPRKGVLGASTDVLRSLNAYGAAFSHYKGAALFAAQSRDAARDLLGQVHQLEDTDAKASRKLRTISNELARRAEINSTAFTEQRWAQIANNVGFGYYLVSASYNVLNMSQPILLTTPYLAGRFGTASTTAAMARAYRLAGAGPLSRLARSGFTFGALKGMFKGEDFDRKNYDVLTEMRENLIKRGDLRHARLLHALSERNMIDATVAMDMAQGARQAQVDPETGASVAQGKLAYLTEWMRMAPHITEVMNRSVTAIAAFDLEYARLKKQGKLSEGEMTAAATEYAADAINDTQFNYQNWNKPRVLQGGGLARTALMFKQHPQHIYYFMASRAIKSSRALIKKARSGRLTEKEATEAKEAIRQLAMMVGMHMLAAGAIGGLPEPLKWLMGWLSALFGEDDQPFNFELEVQNAMADWLGPEWGQVASRGLPMLAGVDLSSRIGINSLLMFDPPDASNPDAFLSDIFRIAGGPMATLLVERPYQAYSAIQDGDYTKAVEAVTPKLIRDPVRAWRTSTEGFTTYAGRVYSETNQMSPLDVFYTSMGMNPGSTSSMYLSREIDTAVDAMTGKRTRLMETAYFARKDREAWRDSLNEIRGWNHDNPAFQISVGDLVKSMKNRARNQKKTRGGMLVPEKYEPWARYQNRFRDISYPGVTQ